MVSVSFSLRGAVDERWYNRDKDAEYKWASINNPNFLVTISREGEDSDGPAYSKSSSSASQHLLYAHTELGADGSANHDIWEYWGSASLDHDWVNKEPDAHGGDSNGDFGSIFYSVHLTDFGHLAPEGTISDCKASGSVWSDAVYVPNQQLHHTATSKTHDDHTDVYLNGELEQEGDAEGNNGHGNNDLGIFPTDPNQSPSPGESYEVRLTTDTPYSQVYWYVKAPWETSYYGTNVEIDNGDGSTTEASLTYTFPSGAMHIGEFIITAYIYQSDQSVYEETYTVNVTMP